MSDYQQDAAGWEWQAFENEMRLASCVGSEGDSEAQYLALLAASQQNDDGNLRYALQVDEHLLQAQAKLPRVLPKPINKHTDWRV